MLDRSEGRLRATPFRYAEGAWLAAEGRAREALDALRALQAAPETSLWIDPTQALSLASYTAWLELEAGDADAAASNASIALDAIVASANRAWVRQDEARTALVLGRAIMAQGHVARALPILIHAVDLHRAEYDPEQSLQLARALRALSSAQKSLGLPYQEADGEATRIAALHGLGQALGFSATRR
jgi:hypothetical protein